MRRQVLLLLFSLFAIVGFAQQRTVTGTVVSAEDGLPIIGASVLVKGTSQGTSTDLDGKYSIKVNDNASLTFSYVGMQAQTVQVNGQSVINVTLQGSSSQRLEEVVVTAMGIREEKKKLNFAVQSLNADEVTAGQSANFVNSLQGKIAGVSVSGSGGSPNASSQIIIRAISSINSGQNNEPLFVIDGMPMRGGGTSAGDINPNDIENMTVLKGAAASALYGSEAANGVILITTKSGKSGQIVVNGSASVQIDNSVRVPKIQQKYVPGSLGFYKENSVSGGWGPMLKPGERIYDNVGNFLGTGLYQKYDVNASGGTDKFTAYASFNYTSTDGVAPEDYRDRMGALIKATFTPTKWVKINASLNYIDTKSRSFGNNMSSVYTWPINNDMRNYKTPLGKPVYSSADGGRYDNWDALTDADKITAGVSPYWGRYEDWGQSQSSRMILNGSIEWTPIKDLTFTGKIAYDKGYTTSDSYGKPRFDKDELDESVISKYLYKYGSYTFEPSRGELLTVQGLATYNVDLFKDLNMSILAGAEIMVNNSYEATMAGQEFVLEGDYYSFNNTNTENWMKTGDYPINYFRSKKNKYGYFGELRFDYKGIAQLSGTARYDGSSTLKQAEKSSYFYPSVTAGLIFSELFHLSNDWFSYGKIRGNWAQVGKDATPNKFTKAYREGSTFPDGGYSIDPTSSYAITLEPEMTKSWEIGADLRFFDSRTRLDVAYYSTMVDNQIVTVRVSPASGTILQVRNEGSIENHGIEATLSQDILRSRDFEWTANLNFGLNRGVVKSLPEDVSEIQGTQFSDIYTTAYLHGSTTGISGKDYMRSPDGQVLIDEDGYPIIDPAKSVYIGNREPDFLLGLSSTFRWKDLSISFLLDGRVGGDVYNGTARSLFTNGMHKSLENYRNREVVVKGVVAQPDGTYVPNTKPIVLNQTNLNTYFYGVSSNFIEDGSYLRLSYVTVGYDFTRFLKKGNPYIKGLRASITGRNLFLLTRYSGSDPQISTSAAYGTGTMGIDNMSIPATRSFNFTINATF